MAAGRRRTGIGTIYALAHPETGEIRYVGKTLVKPLDRMRGHLLDARTKRSSTYAARWLRTLDRDPKLIALEVCAEEYASHVERYWIAEMRERGARLTNLTNGGDGIPGFKLSEEHKAKIAAAQRGRRHTDEVLERISRAKRTPGSAHSRFVVVDGKVTERVTDPAARNLESSARMKRRWQEKREEMLAIAALAREAGKGKCHGGEASRKRSESFRLMWADPAQKASRSAAISAARRRVK